MTKLQIITCLLVWCMESIISVQYQFYILLQLFRWIFLLLNFFKPGYFLRLIFEDIRKTKDEIVF